MLTDFVYNNRLKTASWISETLLAVAKRQLSHVCLHSQASGQALRYLLLTFSSWYPWYGQWIVRNSKEEKSITQMQDLVRIYLLIHNCIVHCYYGKITNIFTKFLPKSNLITVKWMQLMLTYIMLYTENWLYLIADARRKVICNALKVHFRVPQGFCCCCFSAEGGHIL